MCLLTGQKRDSKDLLQSGICNTFTRGGQGGGGTGIRGAESGVEGAESGWRVRNRGLRGRGTGVEGAGSLERLGREMDFL